MSLIKFSVLVSEVNGLLNGSIIQHNRIGSIVRNSYIPKNPRTQYQFPNRINYQFLSNVWYNLDRKKVDTWLTACRSITWYNRLGQPYHPTGQQLFLTYNQNIFLVNGTYTDVFISPVSFSQIGSPGISPIVEGQSILNILFPGQTTDTNIFHIVSASPNLNTSINYAYKYLRDIAIIPPGTSDLFDIYSAYVSRFPAPVNGKKIFFALRPIQQTTGAYGTSQYTNTVVLPPFIISPIPLIYFTI